MKSLRNRLFHFLGGIRLALVLIATTALFVIAGTFLESVTGSHRYAAYFTYSSPLFAALLWGFFTNILFASLRRWPFQWRHIPFLITHAGLLMILGGTLIKHSFGIQGSLLLVEGSGSHEILLPDTQAILVETRENSRQYPLSKSFFQGWTIAPQNEVKLLKYIPHVIEQQETWIKERRNPKSGQWEQWLILNGIDPLPLARLSDSHPVQAHLTAGEKPWNILAVSSEEPMVTARQVPAVAPLARLQIPPQVNSLPNNLSL